MKLATQHNWATQAETQTRSTPTADHHLASSPAGQQCVDNPSTSRPTEEDPSPEAGPDVQEKPTSPGEMGDTIYGMNVSFVDHLDIGLSLGAVLLLLLIIGALCACRKGLCLK